MKTGHQLILIITTIIIGLACEDASMQPNAGASPGAPPPANTFLADSHWPISHSGPYAQASTVMTGPQIGSGEFTKDIHTASPGMITMTISGPYSDGEQIIWGSNVTDILKLRDTGSGYELIDKYEKEALDLNNLDASSLLSGAYTLIDRDNELYVPGGTSIAVYGDVNQGESSSMIELKRRYEIPQSELSGMADHIGGLNMTYDGYIVYVTDNGLVGLTDRTFSEEYFFHFDTDETISNSIACDEEGGIYVVTSKNMYRVQWTGTELTIDESEGGWSADYETGEGATGIRLGDGSGSTPSLMGVGDEDKFVVITDGQDLMHLVLFWRSDIPADWQQIEGTRSRRIAAQVPVTFGDQNAALSLSEQSVCINGYGALVVNNLLASSTGNFIGDLLFSGIPDNAPYGAEKFEWHPESRQLHTAWVNNGISFPNGIPCMSSATNLIYNIGQNAGVWNFSALNWTTGQLEFRHTLGHQLRYNSAYAATEIGLHSSLYCGGIGGNIGMWTE